MPCKFTPAAPMSNAARILIIDGDHAARATLIDLLREEGHHAEAAVDRYWALPRLEAFAPHLVIVDVKLLAGNRGELLRGLRARDPECVVLVTVGGVDAVDSGVAAVREGATDYLSKPIHRAAAALVVERSLELRRLRLAAAAQRGPFRAVPACAPVAADMPAIPGASLPEIERYAILKTLDLTGGSRARAAQILKISARKIQYKLVEYDVEPLRRATTPAPREPGPFQITRLPGTRAALGSSRSDR